MRSNDRRQWVIESLVIVTSILLAFWIDARWGGVHMERREAALEALVREELEAMWLPPTFDPRISATMMFLDRETRGPPARRLAVRRRADAKDARS